MTSQKMVARGLITSATMLSILAVFCSIPFDPSTSNRHYVTALYPALVILAGPWLIFATIFLWRFWSSVSRKTKVSLAVFASLIMFGCAILPVRQNSEKPLGERQPVCFPVHPSTCNLPEGDFSLFHRIREIPQPIRKLIVEANGSRFVMAEPGRDFEATDYITDVSLPRMRLIFAGRMNDTVFLHFEHGGYGHSFVVECYRIDGEIAKPLWSKYLERKAANLADLRSLLSNSSCSNVEHPCEERSNESRRRKLLGTGSAD